MRMMMVWNVRDIMVDWWMSIFYIGWGVVFHWWRSIMICSRRLI
jgi:hypothetical protein